MEENKTNDVVNYASQKFAEEQAANNPVTEIVAEDTTASPTDAPVETEIVEAPKTTEEPIIPAVESVAPVIDYSQILSETSEGLFTDLDSFKAALPKIKEYDTVLSRNQQLEEQLKVSPFVNEFSKTIDTMLREGKTGEEVENFIKISKIDIDSIPALEAKVMVMVKNGYSEDIAKKIVAKDFPIDDFEEGSTERLILEEELRVSSLEDRKVLREFKKELTTVDTTAKDEAERVRLANIATQAQHETAVKQALPKIAESIKGIGEVSLFGKEGEDDLKLNFDYEAEFKSSLPEKLEAFFLDGGMEVNEENIELAQKYIKADYLEKNFTQIAQSIAKHVEAVTTEKIVNKYENRTGLPTETPNVVVDDTAKQKAAFLHRIAFGK